MEYYMCVANLLQNAATVFISAVITILHVTTTSNFWCHSHV